MIHYTNYTYTEYVNIKQYLLLTKREELSLIRVLALPKAVNKNRKINNGESFGIINFPINLVLARMNDEQQSRQLIT